MCPLQCRCNLRSVVLFHVCPGSHMRAYRSKVVGHVQACVRSQSCLGIRLPVFSNPIHASGSRQLLLGEFASQLLPCGSLTARSPSNEIGGSGEWCVRPSTAVGRALLRARRGSLHSAPMQLCRDVLWGLSRYTSLAVLLHCCRAPPLLLVALAALTRASSFAFNRRMRGLTDLPCRRRA